MSRKNDHYPRQARSKVPEGAPRSSMSIREVVAVPVDYRTLDPDPLEQLVWGIVGKRDP